jgi:hypothetical protein
MAGNETKTDRVLAHTEDNRDARGCRFCSNRRCGSSRSDEGYPSLDEIGHDGGQPVVLTFDEPSVDGPILAVDKAGVLEALGKDGGGTGLSSRSSNVADDRQRPLLGVRSERPASAAPPMTVINLRRVIRPRDAAQG